MREEDKLQNQAASVEAGKQRKPPSSSHSPAPLAAHISSSVLAVSTAGTRRSAAVACIQLCSFPLPGSLKYPEERLSPRVPLSDEVQQTFLGQAKAIL